MTQALLEPGAMREPLALLPESMNIPRKKWTRDECYRLMEAGLLPEGKFELINGDIILKMGHNPPHVLTCMKTLNVLADVFGFEFMQSQAPLAVSGQNDPEPDTAVLPEPLATYVETPRASEARLIIEVSDTTLRWDLTAKALVYSQAGVREYWVVNINARTLHVFQQPGMDGYGNETVLTSEEEVRPLAAPSAVIRVADLLP